MQNAAVINKLQDALIKLKVKHFVLGFHIETTKTELKNKSICIIITKEKK